MEPKPEYFTFQNSTLDASLEKEPETLQGQIELLKRILDDVVLPRLAALESRQPPPWMRRGAGPPPVRWDGLP